jgi:hypothetical protein
LPRRRDPFEPFGDAAQRRSARQSWRAAIDRARFRPSAAPQRATVFN